MTECREPRFQPISFLLHHVRPNQLPQKPATSWVTVGDRLRVFTRTYDAEAKGERKWLSSNGDVVEIRALQPDGLRVRNADGDEGLVTWAQMKPWRAPKNDPVRVTYGYAVTIDTAQSLTKSAALLSMPDGSSQVSGYKAYTAGSRQQVEYHMVVSDAAERREIVKRQMIGLAELPREEDVIRNLAANLGRFETKRNATDLLIRSVEIQRAMVASFQRGVEPIVRRQQLPPEMQVGSYTRQRLAPVIAPFMAMAQQVQDQVTQLWQQTMGLEAPQIRQHRPEREQEPVDRGPSMSL